MKIGSKSSKTKMSHEITRQEQNRRNNIKRLTVSAVVALVLFIALTIIQSSILNQEESIKVYQVAKDIKENTKITSENINEYLKLSEVKESLIPEGYVTDASKILDKFSNRTYKAKDIVTEDGFTDSAKLNISNIKNPVQVSFSLADLSSSVSGTIREGDYVNIYGMRNGFNKDGEVVLLTNDTYTFKHVYIEKAYNSAGEEIDSNDNESEAALFTITIEEKDVDLFNEMLTNCSLKVAKIMYETDEDYKAFLNNSGSSKNTNNNKTVTYNNTNQNEQNKPEGSSNVSVNETVTTNNETNNTSEVPLQALKDSLNNNKEKETSDDNSKDDTEKSDAVEKSETTETTDNKNTNEKETTKNTKDTKEK